ncbi:uncharacterized protein [Haliotis cracherodii]|uniref:uncharacterized protein n=1 Tax=Haliotis cracherodii TaxID=6455 RepID=UPI0039E762C1
MENCMKRRDLLSEDSDQENCVERGIISPYKKLKLSDSPFLRSGECKVQCTAPIAAKKTHKVLQSQGQLKVSAYMNFGLLTVHVVQARNLSSNWKPQCDSYVKMSLVPDESRRTRCKTQAVLDSNNPTYDDKFSFELLDEDQNKRLLISLWHKDQNSSLNEFLGCMSFGVKHLVNPNKEVNGWYYLLTEEVGRKKHLQVSSRPKTSAAPLKPKNNYQNIPVINKDVVGLEPITVNMYRGKNGYGFSVIDSFPVKVGRVDGASPAEMGGLKQGDCIIKVNGQNVSRSTCVSVAKLVKRSSSKLILDVQREKEVSIETFEKSPWKPKAPIYESIHNNSTYDHDSSDGDIEETKADQCISVDHAFMEDLEEDDFIATSTPLPLLLGGHRTAYTGLAERRKQEAVHRLMSLELDYIDFMHAGMQRYSRPLRHCILSAQQHKAVFQNIEKLVTISEYHIKQMQDNQPSMYSDTDDDSQSSESGHFLTSMGLIYQSKVHMLCQAYEIYAHGLSDANGVLSDLKRNEDFIRFVKNPQLLSGQPSISAFIYRPIQHVKELYQVLQDIFANTRSDSHDHITLQQVVDGMQACVNNITNCSSARVSSWSSLTSSKSKPSSVDSGSMKSSSSSGSSSSSHKKSAGSSIPSSYSMNTIRSSVDSEVMRIQDRLVFSKNVPVFQLCQEERHLIYQGDAFKWAGRQWTKVHMLMFSDVLLQVEEEHDYLRVLEEPLFLRDICGIEAQRKHATEFILHTCPKSPCTGIPIQQKMVLRAPTTEDKCVWKSLIEQRVYSVRGSLHTFSSSSGHIDEISARSSIII